MASSNKFKEEGNKLFMKRNYKEAIEMYTKAIEKSNMSIYYTNRALCYFKLQQWPMAIEDCRRAVELDPHSVKAHFYMGQAACELNHFDEEKPATWQNVNPFQTPMQEVFTKFGLDDNKSGYVKWYRSNLKKSGIKVPDVKEK